MKVIVTGGYGFIGSNFVNFLHEVHPKANIVVVDKLTYAANPDYVTVPHTFIKKDICDVTKKDLGKFDYIINFAAESHVDNSIKNGSPFIKTNVQGTFNLLEVARKTSGFKKFIQISTDEVYGDLEDTIQSSFSETDVLNPSSYYSATKASADLLVQSVGRTFDIPYLIIRMCNNFGENQHEEKFIPKLIKCIKEDKSFPLYGDGQQIREWIYVQDSIQIILYLIDYFTDNEIINIGSGNYYKNFDIINIMRNHFKKNIKLELVEDRPGHDREYSLNLTKYKKHFPLSPIGKDLVTIEDYINEL